MKTAELTRRTAAAVVIALLAACGGGGGGGGDDSGGGDDGGGGSTPGTPSTVTGQYRVETAAQTMESALAAMNAQGAQGYAFLSSLATRVTGTSMEMGDFYVKDSAHADSRLTYALQPSAATADGMLAQLNQQGAGGYAYKSSLAFGSTTDIRALFVKDASKGTTFSYEKHAASSVVSKDAFQNQLNAQGARGYRLVGPMVVGSEMFNLYAKDSSSTTYTYTLFDVASPYGMASGDALRQRLDDMGAQGHLFLGAFVLQGSAGVQVFEKSSVQSGAVAYGVQASDPQATLAQLLARLNEQAAQGYFFLSDVVTNDGGRHTISVRGAAGLRHPLAGITYP